MIWTLLVCNRGLVRQPVLAVSYDQNRLRSRVNKWTGLVALSWPRLALERVFVWDGRFYRR